MKEGAGDRAFSFGPRCEISRTMGSEIIAVKIAQSGEPASLWSTLTHSGPLAFAVLVLLVVFSVVSWGIILVKGLAIRQSGRSAGPSRRVIDRRFLDRNNKPRNSAKSPGSRGTATVEMRSIALQTCRPM